MLHIVMDGAGDVPPEWKDRYEIHVIPVNIHFGERMYLQGIDMDDNAFYKAASTSPEIPKTSQPSPQQFVDFYKKIARTGDTILSVHVTSKLSGTFTSAVMAAKELAGRFNIVPFDSGSGSAIMGFMCREARQMISAGIGMEQILRRLESIRKENRIVLTLETLDFAVKSGRVKALQAALASMLQIKPIIELHDGALNMAERVRTRQRALDQIVVKLASEMAGRLANVGVVHSQSPEVAEILKTKAQQLINCAEIITTELSIGIAANLGPGTVGVVAYPVQANLTEKFTAQVVGGTLV